MLSVVLNETIEIAVSIFGLLLALSAVAGIMYGTRYKVSYETAEALARSRGEALADERTRVRDLEERLRLKEIELGKVREAVARLEALPDLGALVKILDQHEVRAQERHEGTTRVLDALVNRVETSGEAIARLAALVDASSEERG